MSASTGLSPNDIVNVTVSLAPTAVALENFGALQILGDSDVIDTTERQRLYSSITEVTADFGTNTPEYFAADLFFSQSPQPAQLYIGRWARTATSGVLRGEILSVAQQATVLSQLIAISNGATEVIINGGAATVLSGMNFSAIQTLSGAAAVLTTAFAGAATVTWIPAEGYFQCESATTGVTSTVGYFTTTGSGTQVAGIFGFNSNQATAQVAGVAAESAVACVNTFMTQFNNWYGVMFAAGTMPVTADYLAVAALIEASSPSRIQGVSTQDPNTISSASTTDAAAVLQAAGYNRTFIAYSSSSRYCVASAFGRFMTIQFASQNTLITMKFQQEPGIVPETLTETQAATLNAKNCNVYVQYLGGFMIFQQGIMCGGYFIDERIILDAWQNAAQVAILNVLLQVGTKIPQTDSGIHLFVVALDAVCDQFVLNGALAPGVWDTPFVFGALQEGQTLAKGYYVYAQPVALQSATARGQRIAPPIQAALKLAGAVHFVNVAASFVR